ncbi:MAG: GNAT family N-acetyltransferase [Caulobacteraceae bacterium]
MRIRPAEPGDFSSIRRVLEAAFDTAHEAKIIEDVREAGEDLFEAVAEIDEAIVGHVLFSRMAVSPPGDFAALGPLAIEPARQNQGVGTALVRSGLEACRTKAVQAVIVLGIPAYYPRFGFSTAAAARLSSPYSGSAAFMAVEIKEGSLEGDFTVAWPAAFT